MIIDTSELFRLSDIIEATKASNFNEGLGPHCFDGKVLVQNEYLCDKISYEILDALNGPVIPEYLRVGRTIPL